jgi:hypothetical protein
VPRDSLLKCQWKTSKIGSNSSTFLANFERILYLPGTVTSFRPIPRPRRRRHATNWPHFWVKPEPIGANKLKMAAKKIVPRRPSRLFRGSEIQAALYHVSVRHSWVHRFPHKRQIKIYGAELTNPTSQEFLLQIASVLQYWLSSEMPISIANVRFAPLDPSKCQKFYKSILKIRADQSDPILGWLRQWNWGWLWHRGFEDASTYLWPFRIISNWPEIKGSKLDLFVKNSEIILIQLLNFFDMVGTLCYQCTLDQPGSNVT